MPVTLALAALATGAAGLGWSLAEARAFTLRRVDVPVLPAGSPELRVLHVSDLHLVPRQRRKADWLRGLAALRPDLVVSTGDNLAAPDAVPDALAAHGALLDRPGVFVLGSNDYYGPLPKNPARYLMPSRRADGGLGTRLPTGDLVRGFLSAGWSDLTNRRTRLDVAGLTIDARGVDDPHLGRDRYAQVSGPVDPTAVLTIGVTHAPYRRTLDAMTADGVPLLMAGHTHGGQLCLPWVGTLVTNCDLPRQQARGLSRWTAPGGEESWLHGSAGIGTSPFTPVRFACRPEATLLNLSPTTGCTPT